MRLSISFASQFLASNLMVSRSLHTSATSRPSGLASRKSLCSLIPCARSLMCPFPSAASLSLISPRSLARSVAFAPLSSSSRMSSSLAMSPSLVARIASLANSSKPSSDSWRKDLPKPAISSRTLSGGGGGSSPRRGLPRPLQRTKRNNGTKTHRGFGLKEFFFISTFPSPRGYLPPRTYYLPQSIFSPQSSLWQAGGSFRGYSLPLFSFFF